MVSIIFLQFNKKIFLFGVFCGIIDLWGGVHIKNVTNYVANKIKSLRESKNITQQELAEVLGTTQQSIARYESGERKADQNTLYSLAEYFKIPIDDFFPAREHEQQFDELELLFSKNKDILTDEDKEYMKFIIEKRRKEIDRQLGDSEWLKI